MTGGAVLHRTALFPSLFSFRKHSQPLMGFGDKQASNLRMELHLVHTFGRSRHLAKRKPVIFRAMRLFALPFFPQRSASSRQSPCQRFPPETDSRIAVPGAAHRGVG